MQEHLATQTCKIQSAASDPELNAVVAVSPKQRGEMQQPGCSDSSNVCCRGASCPNGPWQRQARRRRPGSRTLANPFALRRELLPTSPKYLDDTSTSATPIACHAPVSPPVPSRPDVCSRLAQGLVPQLYISRTPQYQRCLPYGDPITQPLPSRRPTLPQQQPSRPRQAIITSTNAAADAQDQEEEECQEGYSVLSDGVRRLRYRYATSNASDP